MQHDTGCQFTKGYILTKIKRNTMFTCDQVIRSPNVNQQINVSNAVQTSFFLLQFQIFI